MLFLLFHSTHSHLYFMTISFLQICDTICSTIYNVHLNFSCYFLQEKIETIPITIKIGNAIPINPFNSRQIKNNGSNTIEHIIFETLHAVLIANLKILPNIISIKIIKIRFNISALLPYIFFFHEM